MKSPSIDRILALSKSKSARRAISVTPAGYVRAAVLVPVIDASEGPVLLFTKRTGLVETHKGQISFPGGVVDAADMSVEQTALREAFEEIGLRRSSVSVLGLLDDLMTPTGFVVTPVVGIIHHMPLLSANRNEVEEVFHVPLAFFLNEKNGRSEVREVKGKKHEVWFYETQGHTIWGATANIVRSLLKAVSAVTM